MARHGFNKPRLTSRRIVVSLTFINWAASRTRKARRFSITVIFF
jgi:hypothetical protein